MGNRTTKSSLRNAIVFLNISAQEVDLNDDKFWDQIWQEDPCTANEVIKSIRTEEIRMLRDGSSDKFAALAFKMVERLHISTGTLCNTHSQQTAVLNAVGILIRLVPCIFEDPSWKRFFLDNTIHQSNDATLSIENLKFKRKRSIDRDYTSYLPQNSQRSHSVSRESCLSESSTQKRSPDLLLDIQDQDTTSFFNQKPDEDTVNDVKSSLLGVLVRSICDLLFCPELTVSSKSAGYMSSMIDAPPEDLRSLASFEYVWEPGVGFESNTNSTTSYDRTRTQLLRLYLACSSESLYQDSVHAVETRNFWIESITSNSNRHSLPLFTSLLNTIFQFNPNKISLSQLVFEDTREELVGSAIQTLTSVLDYRHDKAEEPNMFIEYLSRIHREEDLAFLVRGFHRLLSSGLEIGLLVSSKPFRFDHELLILLAQLCVNNTRFLNSLLKSNDSIDILVPILFHMNENYQEPTETGKIYLSAFNLLILSKERNFGVRLNRAYTANLLTNLPAFKGSYADLLIIVFHKLILYGENIYQLFDYLMTIVCNISPYLKNLTLLASKCLIQLFEIFTSPEVIFTEPKHHLMIRNLIDTFNNLLQYQFDANVNLTCAILSKKESFKSLANLTTTTAGIQKVLSKVLKKKALLKQKIDSSKSDERPQDTSGKMHTDTESLDDQHQLPCLLKGYHQSQTVVVALTEAPDIQKVVLLSCPFQADSNGLDTSNPSSTSSKDLPSLSETFSISNGKSNLLEEKDYLTITQTKRINHTDSTKLETTAKWRPSPEWVVSWKRSLPLQTILRLIEVLVPQLEASGFFQMSQTDQIEMTIKFLSNVTLVGLLPVPHPIRIRKYKANDEALSWFRACTWAVLYVRNNIWLNTSVRLFKLL